MADKAKKKSQPRKAGASLLDAAGPPRGSRKKMLIAAALMCVVSSAAALFLARGQAMSKDPKPLSRDKSDEAETADAKDDDAAPQKQSDDTHGEAETTITQRAEKTSKQPDTGLLILGEMLTTFRVRTRTDPPRSVYLKR